MLAADVHPATAVCMTCGMPWPPYSGSSRSPVQPPSRDGRIGVLKALGGADHAVLEAAALAVADRVQRQEDLGGDLPASSRTAAVCRGRARHSRECRSSSTREHLVQHEGKSGAAACSGISVPSGYSAAWLSALARRALLGPSQLPSSSAMAGRARRVAPHRRAGARSADLAGARRAASPAGRRIVEVEKLADLLEERSRSACPAGSASGARGTRVKSRFCPSRTGRAAPWPRRSAAARRSHRTRRTSRRSKRGDRPMLPSPGALCRRDNGGGRDR